MKTSSRTLTALRSLVTSALVAAVALVSVPASPAQAAGVFPPLKVVSSVDLNAYIGKWYEIAAYPTLFERGCTGTTATYSFNSDGSVKVLNECYIGSLDGELNVAEGKATVADPRTNAKLSVSFAPESTARTAKPAADRTGYFVGNYWIIGLDENYDWAVVGDPTRNYLWILSRTSSLDDATLDEILTLIVASGYDPEGLRYTLHE